MVDHVKLFSLTLSKQSCSIPKRVVQIFFVILLLMQNSKDDLILLLLFVSLPQELSSFPQDKLSAQISYCDDAL